MESVARPYQLYKILGVTKSATQKEIRQAFYALAQRYHPDKNPGREEWAEEKFKQINRAYQVLSNPSLRAAYDDSPVECPECWTHEVIETIKEQWRCIHCGCHFSTKLEILETIKPIERTKAYYRWQPKIEIFKKTQCSWCERFYTTQPFLCPERKLQSSCFFFKNLSSDQREKFLQDEKWWWRITDLVDRVEKEGWIKWCPCGSANPNPVKPNCWLCGNSLYNYCPRDGWLLSYEPISKLWVCTNPAHKGEFIYEPKKKKVEGEPERYQKVSIKCPTCKRELFFDPMSKVFKCVMCQRTYVYDDLFKTVKRKDIQPEEAHPKPHRKKSKFSAFVDRVVLWFDRAGEKIAKFGDKLIGD